MRALFIFATLAQATEVCPSNGDVTKYRKYLEQLITKVVNEPHYLSTDECEPSMIGFRCRRQTNAYRFCETLLYRFTEYKGNLKAHTYAPQGSNNFVGQKCILKTIIYKPDPNKRGRIRRVKNECAPWTTEKVPGYLKPSWSEWSDTAECSVSCGIGRAVVTRDCTNDGEKIESEYCAGLEEKPVATTILNVVELETVTVEPVEKQIFMEKMETIDNTDIEKCFIYNGQRDPDGKLIASERECIENSVNQLFQRESTNEMSQKLRSLIDAFSNRLLQLGAELESVAETASRNQQPRL